MLCSAASKNEIREKIGIHFPDWRGGVSKVLGGCATVAGWGNRFELDNDGSEKRCSTDLSNQSQDKMGYHGATISTEVYA